VVLAAGASRRMGRAKLLLPWGDTTILGQLLSTLAASRAGPLVVVTGAEAAARSACDGVAKATWVHNAAWRRDGLAGSLQAGLAALPAELDALLVLPGDLPLLARDTVDRVIATFARERCQAVVPTQAGQRGHPVLFAAELVPELAALDPLQSPRPVLEQLAGPVVYLEVADPGCHTDIDTPGDYERLRPRSGSGVAREPG
jgi:molybdenum cofactor cytidylyltransferase